MPLPHYSHVPLLEPNTGPWSLGLLCITYQRAMHPCPPSRPSQGTGSVSGPMTSDSDRPERDHQCKKTGEGRGVPGCQERLCRERGIPLGSSANRMLTGSKTRGRWVDVGGEGLAKDEQEATGQGGD